MRRRRLVCENRDLPGVMHAYNRELSLQGPRSQGYAAMPTRRTVQPDADIESKPAQI